MERSLAASALSNVFFILLIVSGILAWMFALVHDSRRVAQEESQRQTELLMTEIEAHKQTDMQLQQAKEIAESANQAKTRYLTGISHELRSPLNAILGYAQLLEKDPNIPENRLDALKVIRRSSEHLADLIEGLLDISRIEAGRLELSTSDVNLGNLLDQIISMFQVQAQAKGIGFSFDRLTPLPETVKTDEKRLRQILINLISNAIKYTPEGRVNFTVSYRNQVAEFLINDTGIGIAADDIERVFKPFERVRKPGSPHIAGTGLGLTITRLLTDIMGGDIAIHSQVGVGSEVKVSLMLSSTDRLAVSTPSERKIIGYEGEEQTLFIVDDEPTHRSLLSDMLNPLGFNVISAPDGNTCLDMLRYCDPLPKIFLLDIAMPGMSGWELAAAIRERIHHATIIMISANAAEVTPESSGVPPHDAYLFKPIRITQVLDYIAKHAGIVWQHESEEHRAASISAAGQLVSLNAPLSDEHRRELIQLAKIGYAKGIKHCLENISKQGNADPATPNTLQGLAAGFQFTALINALENSTS